MSKSRVEKQYFFQLMALSSQVCQRLKISIFVTGSQEFLPYNVWILNRLKMELDALEWIFFFNWPCAGIGRAVATMTDGSCSFEINEQLQWGLGECCDVPSLHSSPCLWLQYLVMESQKKSPWKGPEAVLSPTFFFSSPAQVPRGIVWAGPAALQG